MIKETLLEIVDKNLNYAFTNGKNLIDEEKAQKNFEHLYPSIVSFISHELDIFEREYKKGLTNDDLGIFQITTKDFQSLVCFGETLKSFPEKDIVFQKKLDEKTLIELINKKFLRTSDIVFLDNHLQYLNLNSEEQSLLINDLTKQFKINSSLFFVSPHNPENSRSFNNIFNIDLVTLNGLKFSSNREERFLNLFFLSLGGELIHSNLEKKLSISIFNSHYENYLPTFLQIFLTFENQLKSYHKYELFTSFFHYTHDKKLIEQLTSKLPEYFEQSFENFHKDHSLFLLSKLTTSKNIEKYINNNFNYITNLINNNLTKEQIHENLNNKKHSDVLKKLLWRSLPDDLELQTQELKSFTLSVSDIQKWGLSNSWANIETVEKISHILNFQSILKGEYLKKTLQIFIPIQENHITLYNFLKKYVQKIDDQEISIYNNNSQIISDWKEYRLYSQLDLTTSNTNKVKRKI